MLFKPSSQEVKGSLRPVHPRFQRAVRRIHCSWRCRKKARAKRRARPQRDVRGL